MTATGAQVFWWVVLPYLALGVFALLIVIPPAGRARPSEH